MSTLQEDLIMLGRFKTRATEANRKAKELTAEMEQWQNHCIERMEGEDDTSALRTGDGTLYSLNPAQEYATVQDRQAFVDWAKDNAPDLVEWKERKTELTSLVRASIDDGEELPPGIGFYTKQSISMRRSS